MVAVCDVGGGSTEVVVGTELLGPAWVRSVDLGSLRLTASLLHGDPPTAAEIDAARKAVRSGLAELEPPQPEIALATGGSARAVARVIGHEYGPRRARDASSTCLRAGRRPSRRSALGIRPDRARTLLAGALILEEVSRLLGQPFTPSRGGIREGAALRLAARRAAAA